jgi:putative DNA primase/helicase
MNAVLEHALWYAQQGIYVNAVQPNQKALLTTNKGKSVLATATRDPVEIERLFADHPERNVGVVPGPASDLLVLDVDVKNGARGMEALAALERRRPLPRTLRERTPSGGMHIFARLDGARVPNGKLLIDHTPGIEVFGDPYNVVVAPSKYGGKSYELIERYDPMPLPQEVLGFLLSSYAAKQRTGQIKPQGSRNSGVFKEACRLRRYNFSEAQAWERVRKINELECVPPLDEAELRKLFESAWRYPPGYATTDLGNAQRFIDVNRDDVKYVIEQRMFSLWYGHHWHEDPESLQATGLLKEANRKIFDEARDEPDKDRSKALTTWAHASQATLRIEAALRSSRSEPDVAIRADVFDSDPWLLGVQNGVVDLRTGEFREGRRDDFITKSVGCEFDPSARCPTWLAFADRITNRDANFIAYLQRIVGYTLTGVTHERCLYFLYGLGANGKSVFLGTIRSLFGSYAKNVRTETLMAHRFGSKGGPSEDEARLQGARLVIANEVEDGMRFNEALIKDLTGGDDTITARHLFKASFEFLPQFKLWIRGNHRPQFSGDDAATAGRIRLLPFAVEIPVAERDKQLSIKLRAELPGILNWGVEGCLRWQEIGLAEPSVVQCATNDYIEEQDMLRGFLDEQCESGQGQSFRVYNAHVYAVFTTWCESNGRKPFSSQRFSAKLAERGFKRFRDKYGRGFEGLRLKVQY